MSVPSPLRVLYVESGTTGTGGSFRSLYGQVRAALESGCVDPFVILLNESWCIEAIRSLGVPCERFADHIFDRDRRPHPFDRLLHVSGLLDRLPSSRPAILFDRIVHRRLIRRLIWAIRKHRIELVHLNTQVHRDHFGVLAAQACGVPVVQHLRSYYPIPGPARVRHANRHVRRYLAISEGTRDHWIGRGVDGRRITILPNAIDDEPTEALDPIAEWGLPAGHRVIGSVGRLTERRHYDWLLRAFARVHHEDPRTSLVIVGDGSRKREFEELTAELGLGDVVRLPGHDPRGREILAGLEVSVLCLDVEPVGRTLLESWTAGTPVVAARIEPLGAASDGENIVLYRPGDPDDLARQITRLLHDEELRRRVVQGARDTCRARFGTSTLADRLVSVYAEVAVRPLPEPRIDERRILERET